MKKFLYGLLMTAVAFGATAQTAEERKVSKMLTMTVKVLQPSLPMKLDDDTQLVSLATYSNILIYNYELTNFIEGEIDTDQFNGIVKQTIMPPLCENKDLKDFIDAGVVIVYRYLDKNGTYVTEASKDLALCNKTK